MANRSGSSSTRGLLASLWSLVTGLTFVSFLLALTFTFFMRQDDSNYQQEEEEHQDENPEMAVTSRAMAFSALWTAVLASLMSIFGTVILGLQSPTGQYYVCCSSQVHKTTPLALGTFIGGLIMFASLTLVCAVLFGEFQIMDYQNNDEREAAREIAVSRSANAFSFMCIFLTFLYGGFAAFTFINAQAVLDEIEEDEKGIALVRSRSQNQFVTYDGYIGERFDVRQGFVPPPPTEGTLA